MNTIARYTLIFLVLLAVSCEKDTERQVVYRITDSVSGFDVRYFDESGQMVSEKVTVQSAQDTWNYSFTAEDGGIVFVSANYKDAESAIKVQVLVDGKVYKQAASKNDTVSFITVSGVIPIRE
jgi:hypothetical protein